MDRPAFIRKLHGIIHQIYHDLLHTHPVTDNFRNLNAAEIVGQIHFLPVGNGTDDRICGRIDIRETGLLLRQTELAAVDFADIQHIIDNAEQILPRHIDLVQTVHSLIHILSLHAKTGKADHRIHGCAHLMAHSGHEHVQILIRLFFRLERVLQFIPEPLDLFSLIVILRHIDKTSYQTDNRVPVIDRRLGRENIPLLAPDSALPVHQKRAFSPQDSLLIPAERLRILVPSHLLIGFSDQRLVRGKTVELQKSAVDADETPVRILPEDTVLRRLQYFIHQKLPHLLRG